MVLKNDDANVMPSGAVHDVCRGRFSCPVVVARAPCIAHIMGCSKYGYTKVEPSQWSRVFNAT